MSRRKPIFLDRLVCSDFPKVDLSLVNSWSWWSIPILNIDGLSLNAPWFQKISVRKLCSKLTTLWKAHDYIIISCWSWEITSNGILAPCNSHFHQHCNKITRGCPCWMILLGGILQVFLPYTRKKRKILQGKKSSQSKTRKKRSGKYAQRLKKCNNCKIPPTLLLNIITYRHSYFFGTQVHTPWLFM